MERAAPSSNPLRDIETVAEMNRWLLESLDVVVSLARSLQTDFTKTSDPLAMLQDP